MRRPANFVKRPLAPDVEATSVVAFINVATSAQLIAVAEPKNAALREGVPLRATRASSTTIPPKTAVAETQAAVVTWLLPPWGSAAARKTVNPITVMAPADQVIPRID